MKRDYLSYFKHGEREVELISKQLERGFNLSTTTSTGRVLDAISSALGICGERTYEGECSMQKKINSARKKLKSETMQIQ